MHATEIAKSGQRAKTFAKRKAAFGMSSTRASVKRSAEACAVVGLPKNVDDGERIVERRTSNRDLDHQ
jgi:hypothetical protein